MATNLAIDNNLIEKAKAIGHHKTKKDTVMRALQEYIKLNQRHAILEDEGKIEFWPNFDYKAVRKDRASK